jgi:hypothetical protein
VNRDDFYDDLEGGPRIDRERAADYLHRGPRPRPKAPPQEEALFDEPGHQARQLAPLGQPARRSEAPTESAGVTHDGALFSEPAHQRRALVPVEGWSVGGHR